MHAVWFTKDTLNIVVCNLHPGLELTSPVYCSNNVTCHVFPNQQTNTNTIMEASFGIVSIRKDFKGALLYKLKRKHTTKTGNQPNSSIASIKDTITNIYLLVVWNVVNECDNFRICLLEYTDNFTWDEDKLWALQHQYNDKFLKDYHYNPAMWLIHGNVVMKTGYNVTYGSDYKLDITISEEIGEYDMKRPMKIDPKRLVLSLSMLIVLIYMISLSIQPSFKLVIHNQCLNVDLVYPTYITDDGLECHKPPNYKVRAENIMKSGFIIKSNNASFGLLMYKLQREKKYESAETGEDTSNNVHLLVIWRISKSKELHAGVLLVEHTKLKKLYHENHGRLKEYNNTTSDTWFMDDNMALKTLFNAKDLKGNLELSIFIFEEKKRDYAMRTFCIDLTR
jgi:hypothetical protein